ncbi:MAG: type I DNA topoisomerase [Holosporales bacterium]|jgi:DNA topoisomerase-1|nr:type I DNA topoisomerase [Holosporales bacterium]
MKGVVIVESPAKAKAIGLYLGKSYKVIASYGHVRDLIAKDGAVDVEGGYKMQWAFNERGKRQINEIAAALKLSDTLYLATDPDREGEAISWHILEALREKKQLASKNIKRVVFHEITKTAVKNAFETPKDLDQSLVDAYLTRRALDYLVGFSISPVLWRKMPGAKSAGRVQSVALRLVVERELEIQKFDSEEYWSIHADFDSPNGVVPSTLAVHDGKKIDKMDIKNAEAAAAIKAELSARQYSVSAVEKKTVRRNPYAPFTTSTLQQDAVRKLGFSAKRTMQIAQKLYEGISIDGAIHGLITYMRTDSTALSTDAVSEARAFIKATYGDKYLPDSPKVYKTKTKNAQEAHEAIRPTSFARVPDTLRLLLSSDELALYGLIWKRAIASQMENALIDQVSVDIASDDGRSIFRATGSSVAFDGFLKLYVESVDDDSEIQDTKHRKLPVVNDGDRMLPNRITDLQHFTQPPPRFNEASLVKKLEELGIGRPSTYATIMNVLQERKYVTLQKRTFVPDSIGFLVISFLRNFFTRYVEYGFTAGLEEELDDISNGKLAWRGVLDKFWMEFIKHISQAKELTITEVIQSVENDISDYVFKDVDEERACPLCKVGKINLKLGRFGAFLGCSNYPDCKYTKKLGDSNISPDDPQSQVQKLNVKIGADTSLGNDVISLKSGPFGYYLEWAATKDATGKKPKRATVPKFVNDPTELTIDDAMTLGHLPKILGKHPKTKKEIQLAIGRVGPYLKVDSKSFKLEKSIHAIRVTLKEAISIIDNHTT